MGASRIIILVAIALIASAVYMPASAKEIIAGNGSEANFSSVQEAINNSSPGDVILVLPGIYNESVDVKVEGLSILSGSGNPDDTVVTVFIVNENNVTISGFGIQKYVITSINQEVKYCVVKNNRFLGVGADTGPTGIVGQHCFNCVFSDNVLFDSVIGLQAGGDITNVTIENNTIQGGYIGLGSSSENRIINNMISNNISDTDDSYGITLFEGHSNYIANNQISGSKYGILIARLSGANEIINNTLTSNYVGLSVADAASGNNITSNIITNNSIGIWEEYAWNNLVTDNNVSLNKEYGVYLNQVSYEAPYTGTTLFYNNIFNNTVNLLNDTINYYTADAVNNGAGMTPVVWNTTKKSGTSILGGSYLGGNFWAKPDGTGFSQVCIDSNGDGICDLPHNITENDSDYLPLTAPPAQLVDGQLILTEIRLTKNESDQYIPAINGNRIVWTDTRNDNEDENYDIYMYDLSAFRETQITTNESWQSSPAIYNNRVVWVDNRSGNWDIYMYDLSTSKETQITTNKSNQFNPVIYGDRIVWTDERNGVGNTDIYMYDLLTSRETQITTSVLRDLGIAIYGDRILWAVNREYQDAGNTDIYVYNLSESRETQIATNKSVYGLAIYGDRIVWADDRNGNADIYMYNLSTSKETQITTNGSEQIYPDIYGDRIVWEDWRNMNDGGRRNVNSDIYMYDISTSREIQITTNESIQQAPAIYGDRIIWMDWRNGHHDIYMCIISSKEESKLKSPVADFSASPISGYAPLKVLFTDNSTGSPTSWLWDFGDGIHSKHSMNATHTFTRPGKYNISLTVANANGSNTTINPGFINVKSSEAPVADFSVNVTSGNAPLKVLFTDNSTESPTSWFWDFGNGINSKHAINATHTFTKPGVYDITLTVTNTAGSDTMKKTEYITVQST
ncbi:PKD domain-containing protein [Methanosarcina sp. DH2]|uniref:PKD domain-containing protein n=1 Tax=Methanosarcina sp. DH2 TaxID=2605639 RepID=UPI001E3C70B5|nr:PKD domain-containing protein [Methanosarcina sp. DH2]